VCIVSLADHPCREAERTHHPVDATAHHERALECLTKAVALAKDDVTRSQTHYSLGVYCTQSNKVCFPLSL